MCPINVQLLKKNRYFITFVDDFSKKTWIQLIKPKSKALQALKAFKLMAEKQHGRVIKVLRIDGGGNFNLVEFSEFCKVKGMIHELTTPYAP